MEWVCLLLANEKSYLPFPDHINQRRSDRPSSQRASSNIFQRTTATQTSLHTARSPGKGNSGNSSQSSPRSHYLVEKAAGMQLTPRCFVLQQSLWLASPVLRNVGTTATFLPFDLTWKNSSDTSGSGVIGWTVGLSLFDCRDDLLVFCWETCKKKLCGDQILKSSFY